jgi:nucleoside-diphosphate-sugar epimerase
MRRAMKVLVTGAAGFVGRRIVRMLEGAHDVVAVTRDGRGLEGSRATIVQADLREAGFTARLPQGCDAVISLAQWGRFRDFPADADSLFRVNLQANMDLLEWARRGGVRRFVLFSSGGARIVERRAAQGSPIEFYLTTKLSAELLFRCYRDLFETATVLRPYFVYGAGQRRDMLIPRLVESVRAGKPVQLQGGDGLRINPVYVDDLARIAVESLALRGYAEYDVGGPDTLKLRELCGVIGRLVSRAPVYEAVPGVPDDLVADPRDLHAKLPIERTGFERGLSLTLEAERNDVQH